MAFGFYQFFGQIVHARFPKCQRKQINFGFLFTEIELGEQLLGFMDEYSTIVKINKMTTDKYARKNKEFHPKLFVYIHWHLYKMGIVCYD